MFFLFFVIRMIKPLQEVVIINNFIYHTKKKKKNTKSTDLCMVKIYCIYTVYS